MDVSIENKNILSYLEGTSMSVPMKELRYVFENQDVQPCFLDDLKLRVAGATEVLVRAGSGNIKPKTMEMLSESLLNVAIASAVFLDSTSSEELKEETLREAGASLKYIWQTLRPKPKSRSVLY